MNIILINVKKIHLFLYKRKKISYNIIRGGRYAKKG